MLKLPRTNDDIAALSGQTWNRAADELERQANLQVAAPLELNDGPAGRRLSLRQQPNRLYWGVVQCTGPNGDEPDYSDNRYWVALGHISNNQTVDPTSKATVVAKDFADEY